MEPRDLVRYDSMAGPRKAQMGGLRSEINSQLLTHQQQAQLQEDNEALQQEIYQLRKEKEKAKVKRRELETEIEVLQCELIGERKQKTAWKTLCESIQNDPEGHLGAKEDLEDVKDVLANCQTELEDAVELINKCCRPELVYTLAKNKNLRIKVAPIHSSLTGEDEHGEYQYTGGVLKGLRHGEGKSIYNKTHRIVTGTYKHGAKDGDIIYEDDDGKHEQYWSNGRMQWESITFHNGDRQMSRFKEQLAYQGTKISLTRMNLSQNRLLTFGNLRGYDWIDSSKRNFYFS